MSKTSAYLRIDAFLLQALHKREVRKKGGKGTGLMVAGGTCTDLVTVIYSFAVTVYVLSIISFGLGIPF